MVKHRFRAVVDVLDGAPVAEVARRYGTSRQSLHTWLRRFREGGRDGLRDRSRRPHSSPSRVPVEVELAICPLRQFYPKGASAGSRTSWQPAEWRTRPVVRRCTGSWSAMVRPFHRPGRGPGFD
ncbi:helix-turn-helix domain-containing protein [Streptomyces roseoverticillatus]|nr:helix-turn-helix domain-containing protein [Streptomyces roseoverticillatus]